MSSKKERRRSSCAHFIQAYNRLKDRNRDTNVDIEVLRLVLKDSVIAIYRLTDGSIFQHLEKILTTVATEHKHLILRSGEIAFEIHVPVFEDPADDPLARFRVLLDVDEVIEPIPGVDYFELWGLQYDYSSDDKSLRCASAPPHLSWSFLTQERYDSD